MYQHRKKSCIKMADREKKLNQNRKKSNRKKNCIKMTNRKKPAVHGGLRVDPALPGLQRGVAGRREDVPEPRSGGPGVARCGRRRALPRAPVQSAPVQSNPSGATGSAGTPTPTPSARHTLRRAQGRTASAPQLRGGSPMSGRRRPARPGAVSK